MKPNYEIRTVKKAGAKDTVILTPQEIINHLPPAICTEPAIQAAQEIVMLAFSKLGKGKALKEHLKKANIPSRDKKNVLIEHLFQPLESLKLNVRTYNCLHAAKATHLYHVVLHTEDELKRYRNFGTKSAGEVKDLLERFEITPTISRNLQLREKEIMAMKIRSVAVIKNSELYKEWNGRMGNLDNLLDKTLTEAYGVYWKMFPSRPHDYKGPRNAFEKKFPKDDDSAFFYEAQFQLRKLIESYRDDQIQEYIRSGKAFA